MAPYNYISYVQARQELAQRLYDPTETFWTDAELGQYILEALRTWNALTSYWRGDFTFVASASNRWYDLTNATQMPNTLRPYTLTDVWVYQQMEYHLLEPSTGINPWAGSSQFSAADFTSAVWRRRDEILSTTGCTVGEQTVPALSVRTLLPDSVIDIRRVAYLPAANASPTVLWDEDAWSMQAFTAGYPMLPPGLPAMYLRSTQPPISFDTDRAPGYGGTYEVLTINAGPTVSTTTPTQLLIPDDWADVVKWGALSDLLSRESNAKDMTRATYCEQRYRMGMKLLQKAPAMLAIRLGSTLLQIDSIYSADAFNTTWEALANGAPANVYYAGLNLFALSPTPDANGPYSFLVTVVQNAPMPTSNGDYLQVGRDDMDAILDYAQHLASFKMGGEEFTRTNQLLQHFLSQASLYGLKLSEIGEFTEPIYDLARSEKQMKPIMTPDTNSLGGPEE